MTPHLYHLDLLSQQEALRAERSRPVVAVPSHRPGITSVMARLSALVGQRVARRLTEGRPESTSTSSAFPSGAN
jgi:hypothetical protein